MASDELSYRPLSQGLNLLDLPIELLVCIIKYVNKEDRGQLRCVCKSLKSVTDHPSVWRQFKVELTGIHLKKSKKHLWDTVKARNLSVLSLSTYSTLPARDLGTLLSHCPNLRNLTCSCNVMEWIAAQSESKIPNLDTLNIYMRDCNARRRGSCLQNLQKLKSLRNLHIDKIYSSNTLNMVFKHVQYLTSLERLGIHVWVKDMDLSKRLESYHGFTVGGLPRLKFLGLYGIPVDSVMFFPEELGNESSESGSEGIVQNRKLLK